MKNFTASFQKNISRGALSLAVAAGLSLAAGAALADDPASMAPPVQGSVLAGNGSGNGVNAAADSVFNWKEIPEDQEVPLSRASFDQGGYQLYDTSGETIVVPFASENLYVMKFAASPSGRLYFKNEGGYPVLFVPKGGYLDNATVSGARWYPFGEDFHPAEPVFLGIAPSYDEFVNLGWYPDTRFYGGYYGNTSFISGGVFLPTVGLFFEVGGQSYHGWNDYHHYYEDHPGYYRTNYYNRDYYHYAGSHYNRFAPDRRFQGYAGGWNRSDTHGFNQGLNQGSNRGYADRSQHTGRPSFSGSSGSGRTFQGNSSYGGSHNSTGDRSFTTNNHGGGWAFGGNQGSSGGQNFGGGNSGSGRTFRGASNYGGGQSYGGSRSYGGGQSYGGSSGSFGGGRENFSRQNSASQNSTSQRQSFGGGNRGSFSGGSQGTRSVSGGGGGGSRGGNPGGGGNRGGWSGGGRGR